MKSQDTLAALRALAFVAPPSIAVVCAQNGVDNERVALRHFANVYGCVVMMPAAHLEPGVVQAHSWPVPGTARRRPVPAGLRRHRASDDRRHVQRRRVQLRRARRRDAVEVHEAADEPGQLGDRAVRLERRRSGRSAAQRCATKARRCSTPPGIDYASHEEDLERRADIMTIVPIAGKYRTGGSTWQSLARGTGTSRPTGSTARSSPWAAATACRPRSTPCCSELTNQAARDGLPPESMPAVRNSGEPVTRLRLVHGDRRIYATCWTAGSATVGWLPSRRDAASGCRCSTVWRRSLRLV